MDTAILSTKLFIPPVGTGVVSRSRLLERLQGALTVRLTVVSAPAGFGKTTLVSEWVHTRRPPVPTAWLSLEEGENDLARFWDYFIASLRTVHPAVGETSLALLRSSRQAAVDSLLTPLINELSTITGDFVLVLDDYHLIRADAVHQGMVFFLDHMPPGMHLLIATRVDPPLPLPRLRGKGTMLEIGTDDLRFTPQETAALLQALQPSELSAGDASLLCERTEGWAVGLKMAVLSLRGHKDVSSFLSAFTGLQRHVMDYLTQEVLQKQSRELGDFLMKTSVLERLSAPLCDAVTERRDSADRLLEADRAHLFIAPLDDAGQWYRYHHLFGELLRQQLENAFGAEEVRQLHRRASQWYEDQGYPDDAIHHSVRIRDWQRATAIITKAADSLIKRGEWSTLSGWFQAVPEEVLRVRPRAYAHYANVLATGGKLDAAEAVLTSLEKTPDLEESLRGQLTFFRMEMAYRRGDTSRIFEYGEKALEQLAAEGGATRARALHILAVLDMWAGRLDKAVSREVEAVRIAQGAGESWVAGTAASNMNFILWLRGKLRQALTGAKQALELDRRSISAHFVLGILYYELNELDEAARGSRTAAQLCELTGYTDIRTGTYYYLAQCLWAKGNDAEAEDMMAKGDEASRDPAVSPFFRVWHVANRVMFAIQHGDLAAAKAWGRQLAEYPADVVWIGSVHVPPRLLIASGETEAAADKLRSLHAWATAAGAGACAIRVRVYQALAAKTQDEALTFLTDALKMGEPEGYVRTFVDEGKLLAPLLRQAARSGFHADYSRRLLGIIEAEAQQRKSATAGLPIPQSSEHLSMRELEVLQLAAQGLSNRQIAEKLTVTLSTAKAHLHNITGKLGARSRTQAIARARELKLI